MSYRDFLIWEAFVRMLEVLSALTGEQIAVLKTEEGADDSVKGIKQRLAQKIGITRFRLRLLIDNRPLNDDEAMSLQVVQLVILDFLPHDLEQDKDMMRACRVWDDKLLEEQLSQPRNPNFENAGITPLYVAASGGSLKCVNLLLEAGAQTDPGTRSTPLIIAAEEGHLQVVRSLVRAGARIDQGTTDTGATPLHAAAVFGQLEVVRFLVESGANKDQGTTDGTTTLDIAIRNHDHPVVQLLVEFGATRGRSLKWAAFLLDQCQTQARCGH